MPAWIALTIAILAEVVASSALKASHGMTRALPATLSLAGYFVAFWFLSQAMRQIDLSIAYAIWCGLGLTLTAVVGVVFFGESLTPARLGFGLLIVIGTIGLSMSKG